MKSRLVSQVNSRDIDEDVSKEASVSPITSSSGDIRYLKANELDLTNSQGVYDAVSKPTTEEVTETVSELPRPTFHLEVMASWEECTVSL